MEISDNLRGLNCITKGVDPCFQADAQSVLRVATSIRAFCSQPGRNAQARTLLSLCAGFTFGSASKSVRHRVSNHPCDPTVQDEAIDALMQLLPNDAATRYPYLVPQLELVLQAGDDITRAKAASLMDQLDNTIVTVSI